MTVGIFDRESNTIAADKEGYGHVYSEREFAEGVCEKMNKEENEANPAPEGTEPRYKVKPI